ncbi:unnamed protein product [Moneuplotes crassus]|uniref:Uncharacterized protein n=1 Tax=Euplotes crassus TaxID=5936 RepID=A0AAD1UL38_EUPCR|nr:unnamed protein product [Moneuplotes crassus]
MLHTKLAIVGPILSISNGKIFQTYWPAQIHSSKMKHEILQELHQKWPSRWEILFLSPCKKEGQHRILTKVL